MLSKKILVIFFIIIAAGCGLIFCNYLNHRDIETVSAAISTDTEDILAGFDGYIKDFKAESFDTVKEGDVIAEISTQKPEISCIESKKPQNQKAANEYTDAAIMYKDGIISKEQYDTSLNKYKAETKAACNGKTDIKQVITIKSGKIVFENLETGDKVNQESVIAQIQSNQNNIKAYFSPKFKKRIKIGDKAEITIIKYPEKTFTGEVTSVDSIDIFGLATKLKINEDLSELNLKNDDAVMVKILK